MSDILIQITDDTIVALKCLQKDIDRLLGFG
ncbi:MAG: hypothetical protein BWY45_02600 [Euryarchaeota archaeon ADurb.Bin294]|jgi:hypothetical protein|nr:MAG: hypothetical protein BWY45_02600 [Euryarchaeota archaeon ADurb.Bin294]